MNRRDVLLGAIALVGGVSGLASCAREEIDDLDLHSGDLQFFDADQMRLLSRVVDIIIPHTDTPGALEARVDVFIDQLMANWAADDTRKRYISVLQAIDQKANDAFGELLADCTKTEQHELIGVIDNDAYTAAPELPGFRDLKALILAGYYTSEIGASVELQFELVPGRYLECAPIEAIGRAWAHS